MPVPPLSLLHGFGGGPGQWAKVQAHLHTPSRALTLPGHAGRPPPRDLEDALAQLEAELPAGSFLVGYSLGGRLALQLLSAKPAHYRGAVLIGAHPGLQDPLARAERLRSDEAWAQRLERQGLGPFFEAWDQQALFAGHRTADPARDAERRGHDPLALAATLRALSLAKMPADPTRLQAIRCPVLLVAGALDQKFVALGRALAGRIEGAELKVVPGAGHPLPEQAPEALAALIQAAIDR